MADSFQDYWGLFWCEGMGSLEGDDVMCSSTNGFFGWGRFALSFVSVFGVFSIELIPPP